ncbi:DNA ligase D [Sphingobium boeckii]|uniref:DNA ligase (ATP) n=1 Tax=Sphingobium boeckii TaxID=1082345 RepID=A0A7W9AHB2_9SPHN|nr:DNA ligase D [Sphingobium boeckii]MBB5685511.1 bifunctional non-homologous end joining protein LigD [Sphingobium boeckii]
MANDPLATYNAKRDFGKTAEPKGTRAKAKGNSFMVQKHDATRLHFDFRLELDGVLKSWAVTRGPSPNPDDKRLAVRTEDHPLSYATFEGTIPKGEYGGGTVMLWDRGTWASLPGKDPSKTIEEGHLHFTLYGERMKGEWLLVRMKPRPGEKRENWLLRKVDDAFSAGSDDLVGRALTSVATGRTMAEIEANAPETSLKGKRGKAFDAAMIKASTASPKPKPRQTAATLPAFRKPQLATLVDSVPAGSGWLHEVKYDGYRCQLAVSAGQAKIYTRSGLDWTDKFQAIADAAMALDLPPALIDGEIVKLDAEGNPSFSGLQAALKQGDGDLTLFAFDLLSLEGQDLTGLPNITRKERLAALLAGVQEPIVYADHMLGSGEKLFDALCGAGQEGIISKKADAPYRGMRTKMWLKVKCTRRQEFVIVGWLASGAKGRNLKSLLLGVNDDDGLRYAGKVGTGFDLDTAETLLAQLQKIERQTATVEAPRAAVREAHWVAPKLVAEIAFAEFTADNVVRHASFIGLRDDKPASAVKPEKPVQHMAAPIVKISSADRMIFPESKVTKGDLAAYYESVGPVMAEWALRRPISLVRCPQGRAKHCFFQKHDAGSFGDHVHHVDIREKDGGTEPYLYVEDSAGLIACVQMGTIEFHGWGSSIGDVEKADRMIFDLDPDTALTFEDVKKAAVDIRRHLEDIGLASFPLLSGGKGVHVVVPLIPDAEWPAVKDFAQRFAQALAQSEPDRFIATMSKAKRKGLIFIDWLRNQRGATAILPYSARARPGAPVSAPVSWEELETIDTPSRFSVKDADLLLERATSKALKGWGEAAQRLPDL